MSKRDKKTVQPTSTIFGDVALTMQQRKQLEKEEKAARRAAKKQAREENAPQKKEERKQVIWLIVALVALIALGVGIMLISNGTFGRGAKIGRTYYIDQTKLPEKDAEGLTATINQVYYTKNGGLRIDLTFANGMNMPQHPTRIRIKLMNGDGDVITDATLGNVPSSYYVIHDGFNTYEAFIPKQFIQISDDSLATISYEITVTSEDHL